MMSIIDFNTSEMTMEIELERRAVGLLSPDLEQECLAVRAELFKCTDEAATADDSLLSTVASANIDVDDNAEIVACVRTAKAKMKTAIDASAEARSRLESLDQRRRRQYTALAELGARLFGALTEMSRIDPMYQFSMADAIGIFEQTIRSEPTGIDPEDKLRMERFALNLAKRICSSVANGILERDRILFGLNIAICLETSFDRVSQDEIDFLASALPANGNAVSPLLWLSDRKWGNLAALRERIAYGRLIAEHFASHETEWRQWCCSDNPEALALPVHLTEVCQNKFMVFSQMDFHRFVFRLRFVVFVCSPFC